MSKLSGLLSINQPCVGSHCQFLILTAGKCWHEFCFTAAGVLHLCVCVRIVHVCLLQVLRGYGASKRRLIVLGYNATLTTAVEAPRQPKRHFDQIKALTRVNPRIFSCLEVCKQGGGYSSRGVFVEPPCGRGLRMTRVCVLAGRGAQQGVFA
jgi:hypothetical protein